MSYTHLAGRLIETQRAMLGQRAVDMAQATDGIEVTDSGTVEAVEGREVIGALVAEYVDVLGAPAQARLQSAAVEFEDELVLPENLGGPADPPESETATDTADEEGTEIEIEPAREGAQAAVAAEQTGAEQEAAVVNAPATEGAAGTASGVEPPAEDTAESTPEEGPSVPGETEPDPSAETDSEPSVETEPEPSVEADPEPDNTDAASADDAVTVEYTTREVTVTDADGSDLESVYLMAEDEHGWETPITARDAILDAVTGATDLARDDIDDLTAYVDPDRAASVLGPDGSIPCSFEIEGHNVTLHPSGKVRIA